MSAGTSWVVLVACAKTKARVERAAARDLYASQLFRGMRDYAIGLRSPWYILSAKHGVLDPDTVIEPYETALMQFDAHERAQWGARVVAQLEQLVPHRSDVVLLAGKRYREQLTAFLAGRSCRVHVPLQGLSIGEQLAWLKRANERLGRVNQRAVQRGAS